MSIPKSVKVALALLACILCICSLCYACTSALIQKILPDNPGSRDWRYVLHNGYEIWHLNSSHIVLVKDGWSEYTNTVVDTHIVLFCYSDEYIGLQCTDPQTNADAAEAADLEYFCLNEKVCVFWRSEATSYHAVCVGFRTSHTLVHILSGRRMQKSLL